jgi:ribonuclease D
LGKIDGLPAGLIRRSGADILDAILASRDDENDYRPLPPPDESQKAQLKSMQKIVAECADDLGLAAETIASKRDLAAIILGAHDESKVLSGWRRELIGDRLLGIL